MQEVKEKVDVVPVLAVGLGAAALGLGLYFYTKKPAGVEPGGTIRCHFKFDYLGEGGTYVLQVSLGHVRVVEPWFDHIAGLTKGKEIELLGPDTYEEDLDFDIPIGTTPATYDAEALIRTPEMDWLDYLIKKVTKGAITVRE